MKALKVAVCDDNAKERAFFRDICKAIKDNNHVQIRLKEYENGDALLFDMEDPRIMTTVDIVLLDIHMPGKNGMEAARMLRKFGYQGAIIFITKSNDHWREAFEVKAFNYITKDNDLQERFIRVFWEAIEESESRRAKTLLFSSVGETRQIDVNSISHFEVDNHLIKVYYSEREKFVFTSSSLAKIESLLFGNDDFIRVHRSFLVSVPHIAQQNDNNIVMRNGATIPISRRYLPELRNAIAETDDGR